MRRKQVGSNLLGLSVGCFLIMSISFLLMPITILGILPGLLFWIGLMLGITLQILLEMQRRRFFKAHNVDRRKMQKPRCGLLTFGSNRCAKVTDIALFICLLFSAVIFGITKGFGYVCYICISCTAFLFCMHCVLNGRNYFHVMHSDKVRKAVESNQRLPVSGERTRKKQGVFEK